MTLYYLAGWVGVSGDSTCTIAGNAASVGTGAYAHKSFAAVTYAGNVFTPFATAAASAFTTAGGGPWTVTWSSTTFLYTISRATNFALVFNPATASDVNLANILGFTPGGTYTGANSYTSDRRPYYVMVPDPSIGHRSASLPLIFEPDDIVEEAVADDGEAFGVAKDTSELWSNWTQPMEPRASVYDLAAATAAPWTWQAFFKHMRMTYPFGLYETGYPDAMYQLRAGAARFKPAPVQSDWDSLYNIPFQCRYLGAL